MGKQKSVWDSLDFSERKGKSAKDYLLEYSEGLKIKTKDILEIHLC